MITYNNPYAQKVYTMLIPLVGDLMARSILKSQTTKLGLSEDKLAKKDLPNLAEGVRKGLIAFVGTNGASQISAKIASIT